MALLGVNDTKCFNEVQNLSPCVWQIGTTGKLEQMMWGTGLEGVRGGEGGGGRETSLEKRLRGYLDALCLFFSFFFF